MGEEFLSLSLSPQREAKLSCHVSKVPQMVPLNSRPGFGGLSQSWATGPKAWASGRGPWASSCSSSTSLTRWGASTCASWGPLPSRPGSLAGQSAWKAVVRSGLGQGGVDEKREAHHRWRTSGS